MSEVSLKEYFESRLAELDKRYAQHFHLLDVATEKAESTIRERLASMNELRGALSDLSNRMATRTELDGLSQTVQQLRREKANLDGRLLVLSGSISVIVSIILYIASRFFR